MATAELKTTEQGTVTRMSCMDCQAKSAGDTRAPMNANRHALAFPGHRVHITVTTTVALVANLVTPTT